MTGGTFERVRFKLERDADGWPPVESEGLWAEPLGEDRFRLANTPWFVDDVAEGEIWWAVADEAGVLWVTERLLRSPNCTIRVIPFQDGPLKADHDAVMAAFVPLGAELESAKPAYNIVAMTVPPDADRTAVKARLERGVADGSWVYDEGCVTDAWRTS